MKKAKRKIIRYKNLISSVINWGHYLLRKIVGFNEAFEFHIKHFGKIRVPTEMLGPFRENFLDNIYFRYIPQSVFENVSNPYIIDVGANAGFFSLAVFAKFPSATIYSFEPHPYCFEVMENYK
ncbi:hypothetical protein ACFLT1_07260, partial [Bacteroidota bacterium]